MDILGIKGNFKLVRYVFFVDCFGYDILMVIMLNGVVVMDVVFLLIVGNEFCF